jgi:hypothetical protein
MIKKIDYKTGLKTGLRKMIKKINYKTGLKTVL